MNNAQHSTENHEQTGPDLDAALEVLQAVVMAQKAQIDALLASLESLLTSLPVSASLSQVAHVQWVQRPALTERATVQTGADASCVSPPATPSHPQAQAQVLGHSALLGNPLDPQFASLHQLMRRLKHKAA